MKLEDQVIKLNQAQKLKKLGLTLNSHEHWYNDTKADHLEYFTAWDTKIAKAYSVAELMDMIMKAKGFGNIDIFPNEYGTGVGIETEILLTEKGEKPHDSTVVYSNFEKLSEALGDNLIQLIESKLLIVEDLNRGE